MVGFTLGLIEKAQTRRQLTDGDRCLVVDAARPASGTLDSRQCLGPAVG